MIRIYEGRYTHIKWYPETLDKILRYGIRFLFLWLRDRL